MKRDIRKTELKKALIKCKPWITNIRKLGYCNIAISIETGRVWADIYEQSDQYRNCEWNSVVFLTYAQLHTMYELSKAKNPSIEHFYHVLYISLRKWYRESVLNEGFINTPKIVDIFIDMI